MRYSLGLQQAVGIALVLALALRGAQGAPQIFEFGGIVDFVEDGLPLDSSVAVGVPFFGSYTFDPAAVEDGAPNDARVGSYYFGSQTHMEVEIGNYTFLTDDLIIGVFDNVTGEDAYRAGNSFPFYALGRQWLSMDILLQDLTGTAFNSDALPTTPPDLEDFASRTEFALIENGHAPAIYGTLTSLTPEPGSLVILGIGAAVLVARRRKG